MNNELNINFNRIENNAESNAILQSNKTHLSKQCKMLLDALMRGEHLTTAEALIFYGIGDMRRRVKDLRDAGYQIKDSLQKNRYKKYYIENICQ